MIVVITRVSILQTNKEDGSLVLEYDIEQQRSQDEVSSIDQFVGLDHQHCSIFVDDFGPPYNPYESEIGEEQEEEDEGCASMGLRRK